MAFEKRWSAVPARVFTANGTSEGLVTISTTCDYFVGQKIQITATGLPALQVVVKRVTSDTELFVGPSRSSSQGKRNIDARTDLTAYTVAANAQISAAEQPRVSIDPKEQWRAVYAEEPTVAIRNLLVDKVGRQIDSVLDSGVRRLAVDSNVNLSGVTVEVEQANAVTIHNISIALANTEFSQALPTDTKKFCVRIRDGAAQLNLAFTGGQSGTTYVKIRRGQSFTSADIDFASLTLFMQSPTVGAIVEIIAWHRVQT